MPIAGHRDAAKEQHWRRLFAEFRESGLSVTQFCRAKGFVPSQFYDWKKRIAQRDADAEESARRLPQKSVEVTSQRSMQQKNRSALLADWRASGLSGAEYCRLNGINYSNFRNWNRRANSLSKKPTSNFKARRSRKNEAAIAARREQALRSRKILSGQAEFAEVHVIENKREQPQQEPSKAAGQIRVLLPSGIAIEVSSVDFLDSVLTILGR